MKTIEELLRNLARPEVLEFALASDRLPCVKVGGIFHPVDSAAPSTDTILQMLVGVGGSRYVEGLSSRPTQWTTRLDPLGVVNVSAILRNDVVQARFTLAQREAAPRPTAAPSRPSVPALRSGPTMPPGLARTGPGSLASAPPEGTGAVREDFRFPSHSKLPQAAAIDPETEADPSDDDPTLMTQVPATPDLGEPSSPMTRDAPALPLLDPPPLSQRARVVDAQAEEGTLPPDSASRVTPVSPTRPGEGAPPLRETMHSIGRDVVERVEELRGARASATPAALPKASTSSGRMPAAAAVRVGEEDDSIASVVEHVRILTAPGVAELSLNDLLALARATGASALHVDADRPAFARTSAGFASVSPKVDPVTLDRIVRAIVPKSGASAMEETGAFEFVIDDATQGRFKVHASRQRGGARLILRPIARVLLSLTALGVPGVLAESVSARSGMVVLAGPPGSGLSTTTYALIDKLAKEGQRVVSIEQPIEMVFADDGTVSQRAVGVHARDRTQAIRSAVSGGARVIAVELVSAEDVRAALRAAEAGCLVLAQVVASSCARALERLWDDLSLFGLAHGLANQLRMVAAQRLAVIPGRGLTLLMEFVSSSPEVSALLRQGRFRGLAEAALRDGAPARTFQEADAIAARPPSAPGSPETEPKETGGDRDSALDLGGLMRKGSVFKKSES